VLPLKFKICRSFFFHGIFYSLRSLYHAPEMFNPVCLLPAL
jgi:hypothetical protein